MQKNWVPRTHFYHSKLRNTSKRMAHLLYSIPCTRRPYLGIKVHNITIYIRSTKLITNVWTLYLLKIKDDAILIDPSFLLASKLHHHILLLLKHTKTHSQTSNYNNGARVFKEKRFKWWTLEMKWGHRTCVQTAYAICIQSMPNILLKIVSFPFNPPYAQCTNHVCPA